MKAMLRIASVCVIAGVFAVQSATQAGAADGNWEVKASDDKTQGELGCVLKPKQPSRIQVTKSRLEVTGLPKKSILNYQYIIDEASASRVNFPSADMQDAGAVWLDGGILKQIIDGHRLQIRILDRWHEAITEDVGLDGLRDLYKELAEGCK